MKWLKKLLKMLFNKNEIKFIEMPSNPENTRNNFLLNLRKNTDLERDDRNGYRIIPNIRLKDMI